MKRGRDPRGVVVDGRRALPPIAGFINFAEEPPSSGEAWIAAGQNLKRLLSRWGWGRRPWPSGAAGVVLPAAHPVTVSLG